MTIELFLDGQLPQENVKNIKIFTIKDPEGKVWIRAENIETGKIASLFVITQDGIFYRYKNESALQELGFSTYNEKIMLEANG